jgi:predicted nucleic acid-binding protein
VIVVDASVVIEALQRPGPARDVVADQELHAPHLIDAEVAHALRRHLRTGEATAPTATVQLETWRRVGLMRHASSSLLMRVWELRENLTAYDAHYIALAEVLGCGVITSDRRMATAPGARCEVSLLTE